MFGLLKIEPQPEAAKVIFQECLSNALGKELMQAYNLWLDQGASLYVCPERGFLLLSIQQSETQKILFVHAIEGRDLYNAEGMETLQALAKAEECGLIEAKANAPGVGRLLLKIGFEPTAIPYYHAEVK